MNYLGVVLNPAAAKLGTKLLLGCCGGMNDFVGFSVSGNLPTMIFPANDGLTFLPKSCCFFGGLVIPLMMIGVKIHSVSEYKKQSYIVNSLYKTVSYIWILSVF